MFYRTLLPGVKSGDGNNDTRTAQDRSFVSFSHSTAVPYGVVGVAVLLLALPTIVSGQRYLAGIARKDRSPYKGFSGIRVRPDSQRMVYVHDQTVAVVELGPNREMYNCELIEVYKAKQQTDLLSELNSSVAKPMKITFDQMLELMDQCSLLDTPNVALNREGRTSDRTARGQAAATPATILSGILPGTKWCGSGDLAESFYDLGTEVEIDKCCRNHDICPSKVRPNTVRYNMTNNSLYTKSHCSCDLNFLQCLKARKNPTADIMGNIYFNLLRVPCVNINQRKFQNAYRY